jgi:hypothetical protein
MRSRAFRNGWRDDLVKNAAPKTIGAASGNGTESDPILTSNAGGRTAHASNDDDATTPSSQSRFGQQKQPRPAQSARLAKSRKQPSSTTRRPPSLKQFVSLSLSFGANQCQHITRKDYGSSTTAMIRYDEQIVRIFFQQRKILSHENLPRDLSGDVPRTSWIADIMSQKLQNKSP